MFDYLINISGGLFTDAEEELEAVFRFAVEQINDDIDVLPNVKFIQLVSSY